MVRRLAVLLTAALILSGCGEQRLFVVKAVAAGIPSLAPFFEEDGSLGRDRKEVRPEQPRSGLQQGNTPGLYGGTRDQRVCDLERLEDFLTDPRNKQKAREWARIVGITPDRIEEYLDGLTPVLLRHDTLVKNHDYKKGKAIPYDSLFEAGIAVLVNDQGLPAVKCSCGNPLRTFDEDPGRISVEFEDGNEKWGGYDRSGVVTVEPAPRPLERIALLDVDDPGAGINRPVGSTGDADDTFDTTEEQAVPAVTGKTFAEASMELSERGLAVAYPDELPPADAQVTGSDPRQGASLRFGATVALSVAGGESESGGDGGDPGTPEDPAPPTIEPPSGEPSSPGPTTDGPGSGGPSGKPTTGGPDTSRPGTGGSGTGGSGTSGSGTSGSGTSGSGTSGPGTGGPTTDAPTPTGPTPDGPTTAKPPSVAPTTEPTTADPPPPTVSSTPPTAGPTSTGPTSTGPTSTGPTSTGPTSAGPSSTGPTSAGPSSTERTQVDPTPGAPASSGPVSSEPVPSAESDVGAVAWQPVQGAEPRE